MAESKLPAKHVHKPDWRTTPSSNTQPVVRGPDQLPARRRGNRWRGQGVELTLLAPSRRPLAYIQADKDTGKLFVTVDLPITAWGRLMKARDYCYFNFRSAFMVAAQSDEHKISFANVAEAKQFVSLFYSAEP